MSLRRFSCLTLLLATSCAFAAAPVGNPADFAALTIRPNGSEAFDLATGVTTLPEGGTIGYKNENVTLAGAVIRYAEGDFIEIEKATVEGTFGALKAPALRFDVASQQLTASSGATFEGPALALSAATVELNLNDDIAVLKGKVSSRDPDLTSSTALVDTRGRHALLVGPYEFHNGPVVLRGDAGEQLALSWSEQGDVSASTKIAPEVQARFASYLP